MNRYTISALVDNKSGVLTRVASQIFRAKIVDVSTEATIMELTGKSSKLDGFINMLMPYGILELARTGVTSIGRGASCLRDVPDYKEQI